MQLTWLETADSSDLIGTTICLLWHFRWSIPLCCSCSIVDHCLYGAKRKQERDKQHFCGAGDASHSSSPSGSTTYLTAINDLRCIKSMKMFFQHFQLYNIKKYLSTVVVFITTFVWHPCSLLATKTQRNTGFLPTGTQDQASSNDHLSSNGPERQLKGWQQNGAVTGNKFLSQQKDQGQFMLIFIFWKWQILKVLVSDFS